MSDETASPSNASLPQGEEEKLLKTPEAAELEEKLAACEQKRDEYLAGWQRAKADFLNYKKEELRRFEEAARYGAEDLMDELIRVLDSFDLAISAMERYQAAASDAADPRREGAGVEKGIYMIRIQLEDALRKRGLERIKIKAGDAFDPNVAEAIGEVESELPAGTVAEEIEAGYRMYDKIIRPVRVRIAKQKGQS